MRLTLKAVNEELARRGSTTRLGKASGYFFFHGGEANDWLDSTVRVPTDNSFSLPEWVAEFERLKKLNGEIMGKSGKRGARQKPVRISR